MRYLFLSFCLGSLLLWACTMPQQPIFKEIRHLQWGGFSKGNINLTGEALFNNPNLFGGTMTSMELDVFVDNEKSGHVSQRDPIVVPANQDFTIPITAVLTSQNLLGKALSFLTKKEMKVRFNGYITIKAVEVNFKVPVNYEQVLK